MVMDGRCEMIRLVRMGGRWYGLALSFIDDQEVENIEGFIEEGSPVVFCNDVADAEEYLGICDVEMVEI
jgi:hypothetical protein